jgi:para-nitrobenzyl esterase
MQGYWVNFATQGNPNGDSLTDWPRFTAPGFPVQELGDDIFSKPAPEAELCALQLPSD